MKSVCPGRNWGHTSHWSLGTLPVRQEGDPATGPLSGARSRGLGGWGRSGIFDQACQDKRPGRGTPVTYFSLEPKVSRNSPTDHRATLCYVGQESSSRWSTRPGAHCSLPASARLPRSHPLAVQPARPVVQMEVEEMKHG